MKHSRARSPEAIQFARDQRATANEFARTVWQWVRNRQVCRQKFRREYPLPPYTADFCCVELKLILEVDGADYFTKADQERDRFAMKRWPGRATSWCGFPVLTCCANRSGFAKALRSG